MRKLHSRGTKPLMSNHPPTHLPPNGTCQQDRVTLHHEIHIRAVCHSQKGIAHRTAHERHIGRPGRDDHPGKQRIAIDPIAHRATIGFMTDHVSNLASSAPVALEGLTEALSRWEGQPLDDLRVASARISDEFRTWVEDPANAGQPISDAPVYLDRMAVEIIIERRYFTE